MDYAYHACRPTGLSTEKPINSWTLALGVKGQGPSGTTKRDVSDLRDKRTSTLPSLLAFEKAAALSTALTYGSCAWQQTDDGQTSGEPLPQWAFRRCRPDLPSTALSFHV